MPHVRAAVMPAPNQPVELREFPEPDLEKNAALLRVTCSEVCGTDVHLLHGQLAGVPYPIIPGHVSVGILEKIRGKIVDVSGKAFAEGDSVTFLDVHRTCHACWHCLVAKASTRCPSRKVYGITYGVDDGLTGGWAEKLHLMSGTHCISLDGIDPLLFMAGGCGLPTALHAVDRSDIQLGETVLVLGAGPVGLAAVALAHLRGAARVLCIAAPGHRLTIAKKMGAQATLCIDDANVKERFAWVMEQTANRGADVTIEATGAPIAVKQAMQWTRDAGRVTVVGQYTDAGTVDINPHTELNQKHLDIRGVWGSDYSHFYRSVQLLKAKRLTDALSHVSTKRYTLDQTNEALADVESGVSVKALVVPST
ncbi:MAG: zinc-binding dehydrogenase [Planctomycetes bacterium]|nr:zinc-binding dehydrogenase [Planctomycetota bacterium]